VSWHLDWCGDWRALLVKTHAKKNPFSQRLMPGRLVVALWARLFPFLGSTLDIYPKRGLMGLYWEQVYQRAQTKKNRYLNKEPQA